MQEIDFYEVKTDDGNYINRNEIEDSYGYLENKIAPVFREFVNITQGTDSSEKFKELVETHKWAEIEAMLLLHLTLLLIRSPEFNNFIYKNL
ncbi:hypothetical protein J6TS2_39580 [Heyndrickxia sporothermodurans]|nr:hypothetical protein J6TS2_39580 [Heyndrickxia sporothermodurans]